MPKTENTETPPADDFAELFAGAADAGASLPSEGGAAAPKSDPATDGGDAGGAGGEAPSAAPAADGGGAPAGDAAPAAGAEPPAADPGASAEPAAAQPAAPAPDASAAPTADDIVKGLSDLLKQNQQAPAASAEQPPAEAGQGVEPPPYSEAELQVLDDFEKNWPEIHQAQQLQRRTEYFQLLQHVFGTMQDYMRGPLETLRAMQNTLHMTELKTKVPDYTDDFETKVVEWIDTQPAYLQPAYKQVMQRGTTDEVADLIQRYQAATGTPSAPQQQPQAPAAASAQAPVPPKTELSSAAKQAAAALTPVSAERTNVPQAGVDPQDFEGGFAHFAAAMSGT